MIVTAADGASISCCSGITITHVPQPPVPALLRWLIKNRLGKFVDFFSGVDDKQSWVRPATTAALAIIEQSRPDAILVFMMPYSAGLVGMSLKQHTGLPIIANFDDSPTCGDMHPTFASKWHFRRAVKFEDDVVRSSDAVIYVSQRNLERVRDRQLNEHQVKFHLVRYGVDPADFPSGQPSGSEVTNRFRIVYIGGMTGWHAFDSHSHSWISRLLKRILAAWNRFGRYKIAELDHRGSSPVFVAKAAQQVMQDRPNLAGHISIEVYGNRAERPAVDRLLASQQITDVVKVFGPVTNSKAIDLARRADLLFLALPDRLDKVPGGRISAKTYEYLMTDRPILAAIPPGENADFLAAVSGVTIISPTDVPNMVEVIKSTIDQNTPVSRDASNLDYSKRANQFKNIILGLVQTSH